MRQYEETIRLKLEKLFERSRKQKQALEQYMGWTKGKTGKLISGEHSLALWMLRPICTFFQVDVEWMTDNDMSTEPKFLDSPEIKRTQIELEIAVKRVGGVETAANILFAHLQENLENGDRAQSPHPKGLQTSETQFGNPVAESTKTKRSRRA